MKTHIMWAAAAGLLLALALGAPSAGAQAAAGRAAHAPPAHAAGPPNAATDDQTAPPGEAAPPPHTVMTVYVLTFRPGPAWVAGAPATQQALTNHGAYWTFLTTSGSRLAIAEGPFSGVDGSMAIAVAENLDAARHLGDVDPAVRTHVLVFDVRAWTPLVRGPRELPR